MLRVARALGVLVVGCWMSFLVAPGARAQTFETIHSYDIQIVVRADGSLRITETIAYDFGPYERHGIFRRVPTRLAYDDRYDRDYPLTMESVGATGGASADFEVSDEPGGITQIRIGDPDRTIGGQHTYRIVYVVQAALNGFKDHDELYWNAIGDEWDVTVQSATVTVTMPGRVAQVACYAGPYGSHLPCHRARMDGDIARFRHAQLGAFQALTVVIAVPKGVVAPPIPRLVERWSMDRAFERTPATLSVSGGLLALIVTGIVWLLWTRGRDRRYAGSPVDQVMGNPTGADQAVPLFERGVTPVEFAPPEDLRPGQIGTIIDERANTLDVTATIVDMAVRGYLTIEEIPKEGWFGKPDWTLRRTGKGDDDLLTYELTLLTNLFSTGTDVTLSSLKATFATHLAKVEEQLYGDAVERGWFLKRPDKVRTAWHALGVVLLIVGIALTFVLARWTHWGLIGIPVTVGGLMLTVAERWMPNKTAKGTAIARRVGGFRTVIETAETHMSRWAEEQNVFTRFLPYAVVFGCTEKWAKAFEGLDQIPPDTTWYLSSRPFLYADFGRALEGFSVTTGGTIASTPSGSGSSGFGGGGFSGGGGGGGGGGSW